MRCAVVIAAVLLAAGGCRADEEPGSTGTQAPPPPAQPASEPATQAGTLPAPGAELEALIASQGSVTFLSYNGKWGGTDLDSDITFLPDGVAHTFSYSDAMIGYRGTFTVDADGTIVVRFPTFEGTWPTMSLRRDGRSMLLFPKQAAAAGPDAWGDEWPYRQIPAAQEAQSREDIRIRGGG